MIKSVIKYAIVAGLVYTILKLVPSQPMNNRELYLILSAITLGWIIVDYNMNIEKFEETNIITSATTTSIPSTMTTTTSTLAPTGPITTSTSTIAPTGPIVTSSTPTMMSTPAPTSVGTAMTIPSVTASLPMPTERPILPMAESSRMLPIEESVITNSNNSCGIEIEKVKQQLNDQIRQLKEQLTKPAESEITMRYFKSLADDLSARSIINSNDIANMTTKIRTGILSWSEAISALETLKAEGKVEGKIGKTDTTNDMEYNELPSDFFKPIGDKIANKWSDKYSILNTNKWQVPMPRPPICISTQPCKVCPGTEPSTSNYLNLESWDDERIISNTNLNKKWAADKMASDK